MTSSKTKFILSLDGGGTRGVYTANVLKCLSKYFRQPIHELFDMVVGTSAGAMLAAYIGEKHSKEDFDSLFSKKSLETTLDKSLADNVMGIVQFEPVYDGKGKRKVLEKLFNDLKMGDLKMPVSLVTYNITKPAPEIFNSHFRCAKEYSVVDVVDASTAAPMYFPPVEIKQPVNAVYIDGGAAAYNPSLIAYTEAKKIWPGENTRFRILSIGTGYSMVDGKWDNEKVKEWGAIQWLINGIQDVYIEGPNDLMMDQTQKLLRCASPYNQLLRLDTGVGKIRLDDASDETLEKMKQLAKQSFTDHASHLKDFFDVDKRPTRFHNCSHGFEPVELLKKRVVDGVVNIIAGNN